MSQGTLKTMQSEWKEGMLRPENFTTEIRRSECKNTKLGEAYNGTVQHTARGLPCELWIKVNQSKYNNADFPDGSIQTAKNFCRNPSRNSKGIWCYIDMHGGYDFCNAPYCGGNVTEKIKKCKTTRQGIDYQGNLSHTIKGYECVAWHSQYLNNKTVGIYDNEFPDADIYAASNYCRNPTRNKNISPWCFINQPGVARQDCGIPLCDVTDELNNIYTVHHLYRYELVKIKSLDAAYSILRIVPPIMILFGTVTNVFSIKVFSRPSLKESNTSFLMRILSVLDLLSLYTLTWNDWMFSLTGSGIAASSGIGCKLWFHWRNITTSYAGWVICVITLERIIALAVPLRTTKICSKKNSLVVLMIILLIIGIVYVPTYFSILSCIGFVFNEFRTEFRLEYYCCLYNSPTDNIYKWLYLLTTLPSTLLQ